VGAAYLLGWAGLLGSGITTREGAEVWIRLVQVVGVAALVATVFSLLGAWRIARARPGWAQVIAGVLVALAMLETVWLSFGFHLLSARLIY